MVLWLPNSHADRGGVRRGRCPLRRVVRRCVSADAVARRSVHLVAGSRGVVADLLGDELFAGDGLSVAFVGVVVGVAFGDELVAFGEAFEGTFGGGAVRKMSSSLRHVSLGGLYEGLR